MLPRKRAAGANKRNRWTFFIRTGRGEMVSALSVNHAAVNHSSLIEGDMPANSQSGLVPEKSATHVSCSLPGISSLSQRLRAMAKATSVADASLKEIGSTGYAVSTA
jgi:hypothetical protein